MLPTVRVKSVFWVSLFCLSVVPGLCHLQPHAFAIQWVVEHG